MKLLKLALIIACALPLSAQVFQTGTVTAASSSCLSTNCISVQTGPQTGSAGVVVAGTISMTLQFEASADGGLTWVSAPATPQPTGINVTSTTATGTWIVPVAGMTNFRVRASAFSSGPAYVSINLSTMAPGNAAFSGFLQNVVGATDPCQNPAVLKSSVKIQTSSTTAVQLVAPVASKVVYICGWEATIQGSATSVGTIQLEYGTQVTNPCDTGTATLTGALAGNISANVPTFVGRSGSGTIYATTASQQLCAVSTGTTISVQGDLTYVQQ